MKRKIKKTPIVIGFILAAALITGGFILFNKEENKEKTEEKKVDSPQTNESSLETKIKNEKYYIKDNLSRYLKYNNSLSPSKIVADVNSNLDKEKYVDIIKTNVNDDKLIIVNKYYYLTENYIPSDLITLSTKYNTGINSQMRKEAADQFMKMSDAATLDNIIIKNVSGYRSYNYQVNLYDKYVNRDGKKAADTYSARPGFSEHQTGLTSDINTVDNSFENTDAFKWLQENASTYGFILRFPKDKEDITGYQYEPWHYRYVGEKAATQIKKENLTLEEYYAYYVAKNNS